MKSWRRCRCVTTPTPGKELEHLADGDVLQARPAEGGEHVRCCMHETLSKLCSAGANGCGFRSRTGIQGTDHPTCRVVVSEVCTQLQ